MQKISFILRQILKLQHIILPLASSDAFSSSAVFANCLCTAALCKYGELKAETPALHYTLPGKTQRKFPEACQISATWRSGSHLLIATLGCLWLHSTQNYTLLLKQNTGALAGIDHRRLIQPASALVSHGLSPPNEMTGLIWGIASQQYDYNTSVD